MIVWQDDDHQKYYIGKRVEAEDGKDQKKVLTVHAYGTHQKAAAINRRKYYPGWNNPIDNTTAFVARAPSKLYVADV